MARPLTTTWRIALWLCAGAWLALPWSAGAAQERWYTVELIVFERLDSDGLYAERWPLDPGRPSLQGAVELSGAGRPTASDDPEIAAMAGSARAFQRLRKDELELRETWTRFRRSRGFRPLLHVGWRQPGFSRDEARAAHIRTAEDTVDGTVRVHLARYLHVEADLLYYRPDARSASGLVTAGDGSAGQYASPTLFRLKARRRLRSRELHYLDHPLYGVIVQVTPFTMATAPAVEERPADETASAPQGTPPPQ